MADARQAGTVASQLQPQCHGGRVFRIDVEFVKNPGERFAVSLVLQQQVDSQQPGDTPFFGEYFIKQVRRRVDNSRQIMQGSAEMSPNKIVGKLLAPAFFNLRSMVIALRH